MDIEVISNEEVEDENDNINEKDQPSCDPECSESTENNDVECEFENRDGSWWCTTHNCWA